jgi:glycosyl transferase family 25
LTDKFSLSKLLHNKTGAAAYIISPKFAELLLANYRKKGAALADAAIYDNYFKLSQHQLVPAVAIQFHECTFFGINEPFEHFSHISSTEKPRVNKKRFRFRLKRIKVQILNILVYLMYSFKSNLKVIPYDEA